MLPLIASALSQAVLLVGLGWGIASRLRLSHAERLLASAALSGLVLYLLAFGVYVSGLPNGVFRLLPLLCVASLLSGRGQLTDLLGDWQAKALLAAVGFAGVGLVALDWAIPNYSNGCWVGDFWEHWLRSRFFLEHLPTNTIFLRIYTETSRPPLVNLETSALLGATEPIYALFQIAFTLEGVLALLPAVLLARRWGGPKAVPIAVLLLLASPVFVAHATFSWTKLQTVFWVLSAFYFFLRSRDSDSTALEPMLAGLCMGGALVAHYSAVPYAVALSLAWLVDVRRDGSLARRTWPGFAWALLPVLPWIGWAVHTYGFAGTFLSNTTVTMAAPGTGAQAHRILANFVNTLVPRFWWDKELAAYLVQETPLGYFKDKWFNLDTSNFLASVGITGWLVAAIRLRQLSRTSSSVAFMAMFVVTALLLGVAANGNEMAGGTANICLPPLSILGIAFIASQWRALSALWQAIAWIGVVADFAIGVVLANLEQCGVIEHFLHPGRSEQAWSFSLSASSDLNRVVLQLPDIVFVHRLATPNGWVIAGILAAVFFGVILWARALLQAPAGQGPGEAGKVADTQRATA